ncbi:hypothetical protein EII14_03365 [Alloprevotella sp. OH1205_COT-284]|uniref:hypothetical protein n=1 Tax=Alloprevotella sp. OH1205_COT-284 TaxID=2491043 RepID=UPI000F5F7943|nr:hypothetical protein [Alloprevotella sp. OH1205_COT-284]RRD80206.1 hypothetical protein EII14_03365 [Alloprevotella sp. OH1205_COT-284]
MSIATALLFLLASSFAIGRRQLPETYRGAFTIAPANDHCRKTALPKPQRRMGIGALSDLKAKTLRG